MSIKRISLDAFLRKLEEIASLNPTYRSGGSGTDGTCDCIGLIIGAIRRAGGSWNALHGSNYAARFETDSLRSFSDAGELRVGDLVYKAREPGESGYDLPAKYTKGWSAYTGDLRDYYHVGVVTSVRPLRILHMTTPAITVDTKIGKWRFHGWCRKIEDEVKEGVNDMSDIRTTTNASSAGVNSSGRPDQPGSPNMSANPVTPGSAGSSSTRTGSSSSGSASTPASTSQREAVTVESANGLPVKLRQKPSTSCALYWEVASGASAILTGRSGDWCGIEAEDVTGKSRSGWMKAEFVVSAAPVDDGSISAEKVIEILAVLATMEKCLDDIYELIGGRG